MVALGDYVAAVPAALIPASGIMNAIPLGGMARAGVSLAAGILSLIGAWMLSQNQMARQFLAGSGVGFLTDSLLAFVGRRSLIQRAQNA